MLQIHSSTKMSLASRLLAAMSTYADQHQLLKSFRQDLTVFNAETLELMDGWPRYLWVVGESQSSLFPLDFHDFCDAEARATLKIRLKGPQHICFIHPGRIDTSPEHVIVPTVIEVAKTYLDQSQPIRVTAGQVTLPTGVHVGNLDLEYRADGRRDNWLAVYDYEALDDGALRPGMINQLALAESCMRVGRLSAAASKDQMARMAYMAAAA